MSRILLNGSEAIQETIARGPLRDWILQLPEVKASLRLGILENEEQAVEASGHSVSKRFDDAVLESDEEDGDQGLLVEGT